MSYSNMINLLKIIAGIGIVLGVLAFLGLTPFGKTVVNYVAGSTTGSTFNQAKVAAINTAPINGATSTSILNTDSSDRFVTDNFVGCTNATTTYTAVTGAGLASWAIKAATTSTAAPAVISNTNLVMNDTIATGTVASGLASDYGGIALVASTSILTSATVSNASATAQVFRWASGTYMTFWFNATSTASCTVGVHYFAS